MARSTSDEEVQLKKRARRRLVGAVVLATAVAVVLPMVLDTEPRPVSQNVNIQIPSPDSPAYAPKPAEPAAVEAAKEPSPPKPPAAAKPEVPAAAKTASASAEGREAVPPVASVQPLEPPKAADGPKSPAEPPKAAEAPKPAPAKEAERDAGNTATKDAGKPAAKDAAKPAARESAKAAPNGKFVVQVAALADTAKAQQLKQRVAGAGVKAYTEVVKTSKGNVTRVRAGPYETREAAEKARGRLKSAGLDGKVVPR